MKKTLLTLALVACALGANAEEKQYTDTLSVAVNGIESKQLTTVTVDFKDGDLIDFTLNNFILDDGENQIGVGDIQLTDLSLVQETGYQSFSYNDVTQIAEGGEVDGIDDWIGPYLGDVPLVLSGRVLGDLLYVHIDIDMQESLGQTIEVVFGSTYIDETTGIASTRKAASTQTYDLSGRAVKSAKGITIQAGKKVLK